MLNSHTEIGQADRCLWWSTDPVPVPVVSRAGRGPPSPTLTPHSRLGTGHTSTEYNKEGGRPACRVMGLNRDTPVTASFGLFGCLQSEPSMAAASKKAGAWMDAGRGAASATSGVWASHRGTGRHTPNRDVCCLYLNWTCSNICLIRTNSAAFLNISM